MANAINIPITYSLESIDRLLNDFNTIVKEADFNSFLPDQQKIRESFANIRAQMEQQLKTGGKIDVSKIDFTGAQKEVEDFASKMAFVLNEAFDKELQPYMKKITSISDELTIKQKEVNELNKQLLEMEERKAKFKEKYDVKKMPTLDLETAKTQLAGSELRLAGKPENQQLKEEVEKRKELVAILQDEEDRKKAIKDMIETKGLEIDALTIEKKQQEVLLEKEKQKLGEEALNSSQKMLGVSTGLNQVKDAGNGVVADSTEEIKKQTKATEKGTKADKEADKGLTQKIASTFSYGLIIGQLRRLLRTTIATVLELDKAMTTAAMITGMNRKEVQGLMKDYQNLARTTGLATSEIADVITQFLRQGRSIAEAMELAEVAAKSAKVAGISANDAVRFLTSAVNGFGMAASEAVDIADKFAAVAAQSASSFSELATAMSKVAPVAKSAGVGVDFMMGVLAKGLETTREAPENIGTAFKTIFARMREVTDIGKATEDGMSLNRVEKSLQSIGVSLRDTGGQFRNLEEVLIDVGNKWNTLTSIEQAYIATSLAGTRQQPRLLAIFNDFARTKELIQISSDATGELAFQHMEYMKGAEAALSQLKTAYQGFIMTFTDTEIVISSMRAITDVIDGVSGFFDNLGDSTGRNIALIGMLAVAYATLLPQTFSNLANKSMDVTLTKNQNMLSTEQTTRLREINTELQNANGARREALLLEKEQIALSVGHAKGLKGVAMGLKTQIALQLKAIATALIYTLAMGAVVWIFSELVKLYKEATISAAELGERIQENNKQLNDLENKEENVKKLIDRFDQLNRKVTRTKEELAEMVNIAKELETIKIGDQEFNLSRTDITGKIVIDKVAYENFVAAVERERQKLLAENLASFRSAVKGISTQLISTFEDRPELTAMAKKIGYDFGSQFLISMKERGFSQENINKAMGELQSGMSGIDPSIFMNAINVDELLATGYAGVDNKNKDFLKNLVRQLAEEGPRAGEDLRNRIKELIEEGVNKGIAGATFDDRFDELNFLESAEGKFNLVRFNFDEEGAKQFSQKAAGILLNIAKNSEATGLVVGENLTKEVKSENLAKELNASLTAYRNAITAIEADTSLSDIEEKVMVSFITDSMQDENILDTLTRGGVTIETIVKVIERGTTLTGLADLVDSTREKLESLTTTGYEEGKGLVSNIKLFSDQQIAGKMTEFNNAITAAFSASNYARAYELINTIFGTGSLEAVQTINELSDALNLLNSTTAATRVSDQGKLIENLLKLPEQVAKGDLSNFTELVAEFGFQAVNAVLSGSAPALDAFMATQKTKFETDILDAIKNIRDANRAINYGVLDLSDAEADQIAQLELMLEYYERIAGVELLRKSRLDEVKSIVKETNDLYSLQTKLLEGGMSGSDDFMKMLDKAIEASEEEALAKLGTQLEKDIQSLNKLGVFIDGVFTKLSDSSQLEVDTGLSNMMQTLTELVDIQTAAYQRQQKQIEERYKTEVDAIKSAHDEKYSELDYNNKLVETEEKIIESRRQLMGLALSGAARGEYNDAQKSLQKLQQEREKIIEDRMIDEAEKELEKQKNQDLIKAQTDFTEAIKEYTDQLILLTTTQGRSGFSGSTFNEASINNPEMWNNFTLALRNASIHLEDLTNLEVSTLQLDSTNKNLLIGLQTLSKVITNWEVKLPNSGTFGSPDLMGTGT
jgi:TP901 family phage tail tape measure protein